MLLLFVLSWFHTQGKVNAFLCQRPLFLDEPSHTVPVLRDSKHTCFRGQAHAFMVGCQVKCN